jgi:hypothetical protein
MQEKMRWFAACAALAVVPFAAALLPSARASERETIAVVGGFLAAILGLSIAAALGASTVVRDLSERRMSFYFTKPIGAATLWLGKASASLAISFACAAIIAVPAYLASRRHWVLHWLGDVQPLVALAIAMIVIFFVAHVASSVIRSRSPLLALDFLFAILAGGAVYLMLLPLFGGMAADLALRFVIALAIALLVVLAIAPVWQLANGRSDIRRSHVALMRFLWPAVAVVLLIAGGFVAWVVKVSPEDVDVMFVEQPRSGSQVLLMGNARNRMDYHAAFQIDRATGTYRRVSSPLWWNGDFSDDGRVAAWLENFELHTTKGPTGISLNPSASFLLSGDGTRVATTQNGQLAVYDLATGALLTGAALDDRARYQFFFVTPDLVRVIEHQERSGVATPLRVFELDLRARTSRRTAERILERPRVSVSGDGSRMFIRGANEIADGRTAATIAKIDAANITHSTMLYDGRVALITRDAGVPHLRTYERDGKPRHDVAFPNVRAIWIAAEMEDGKLILAAYGKTMYVFDLASGVIEKKLDGIRGPVPRWGIDPRLARFAADQELVAIDAKGKLVLWKHEGRTAVRPLLASR